MCREQGFSLLNITDGGEGVVGWRASPEVRENMSQAKKAVSYGVGSKNVKAKLSEEDIVKIVRLLNWKCARVSIAQVFSVSKSAVDRIATGVAWPHVKREEILA